MHVVIVGAGPAGAATALLLARRGVEVTLVERETDFERVFRGEGLMPSGLMALDQMGLSQVLDALPQRLLTSWDIYLDGEETIVVPEPVEQLGRHAVRVLPQPELLTSMVEEARRCPSFTFEPGTDVRDVLKDGDRVTGVRVQTAGGERDLAADFVIGCDGRGSLVRTRAGLELELLEEHYDVLWCKLPAPERLLNTCSFMIMVAAGCHPAVCYTSWDDRLQCGLILPKGGRSEVKDGDFVEQAAQSTPNWLGEHLRRSHDQIDGPLYLNVMVGRCPRWTLPGLLLLGDAAHPMSPVRAQGINLALRDAIVAANQLVPVLAKSADAAAIDEAALRVQQLRLPEIKRSQKLQLQEAQGQSEARRNTRFYHFAKWMAGLVGHQRWVQRLWMYKQRDLRFGSTDVRLEV